MNSLLLLRSLIVATVLVATAPAALAGWRLIDRTVLDPNAAQIAAVGVMPPLADLSGFVSIMPGAFRSRGSTKSVIPFLMVDGLAQDQPSSAQELWRHFAPGIGEVEVVAFAQAQADVRVGPLGRGLAIIYGQSTAEFLLDGAYGVAHVGLMVEGQSPAWGSSYPGTPQTTVRSVLNNRVLSVLTPDCATAGLVDSDSDQQTTWGNNCPVYVFQWATSTDTALRVCAEALPTIPAGPQTPPSPGGPAKSDAAGSGVARVLFTLLTHDRCPVR